MFHFFKLIFVISFVKSNIKNFAALGCLILLLFIVPYIFDDILGLVDSSSRLMWVLVKWTILLLLIFGIYRTIKGIGVKSIKRVVSVENKEKTPVHKQLISSRKPLMSEGERIKHKHRKHS